MSSAITGEQPLTAVDVFAPWAGEEERDLRLRIHKAQTVATARATRSENSRARAIYWTAAEFAMGWVFRRVKEMSDLDRVLRALSQLFMAADNITQLEGNDVD